MSLQARCYINFVLLQQTVAVNNANRYKAKTQQRFYCDHSHRLKKERDCSQSIIHLTILSSMKHAAGICHEAHGVAAHKAATDIQKHFVQ